MMTKGIGEVWGTGMGVHKNIFPSVLGTENLLHRTLIVMDKSSFKFTICPGWLYPDCSLRAVNPAKYAKFLQTYQNKRYVGYYEGCGTS